MRVLVLTADFHRERRIHARHGSPEDVAMRRVLRQLADEQRPLPGPEDDEALRTPFLKIWARYVRGVDLVVTFVVRAHAVEVIGVRPSFREAR